MRYVIIRMDTGSVVDRFDDRGLARDALIELDQRVGGGDGVAMLTYDDAGRIVGEALLPSDVFEDVPITFEVIASTADVSAKTASAGLALADFKRAREWPGTRRAPTDTGAAVA